MNKIPNLKKILPQSPDEIQRFSSESSSALARMAHVNRAAQYFGMDAEFIEVDFNSTQEVYINRPCGHIKVVGANIPADDTVTLRIIWDSAVYLGAKLTPTPYYAQFTGGEPNTNYVYSITLPADSVDSYIDINIYSALGTQDAGFFYSIVPQ